MNIRLTSVAAFLAFLLAGADVGATPFSSLYSFGDSLSDGGGSPTAVLSIYKLLGGNCDPGHPCPPYYDGHYSNGNVAVEYLANSILSAAADPTNFHNFAVSGATTGIGNYGDGGSVTQPGAFGLPGIYQEIGLYLNNLATLGINADPNALYFLWGGSNDFLTGDSPTFAAQNIAGYVGALAGAGAEHFLVPNLPDLSLTPFVTSVPGLDTVAKDFSTNFNTELATQLGSLSSLFPAIDIVEFDTFSLFNNIVEHPENYGFKDKENACLSVLADCAVLGPDSYVYWDDFHPTTRVHALFGTEFALAVPEPGTIVLLVSGLFAFGVAGRQSRKLDQVHTGA